MRRLSLAAAAVLTATAAQLGPAAGAEETSSAPAAGPAAPAADAGAAPVGTAAVPADRRERVLGPGWRTSTDRAWTTTGDAEGFHLLVADQREGYAWRTAATLAEPGFEADSWIGNACVTGSGERAVVVYAPRTFTNEPELFARGAFAAVVELDTGEVTKLDVQTTLAYFNPGCGTGDSAVLTQDGGDDLTGSRLFRLDTAGESPAASAGPVHTAVQVTSAVPLADGTVVAAAGDRVVRVGDDGELTPLADTHGVPFRLTPDADGGLLFLDRSTVPGEDARITAEGVVDAAGAAEPLALARHLTAGQLTGEHGVAANPAIVARGPWTEMGVARTPGGEVFVTGESERTAAALPDAVGHLPGTGKDARLSTAGAVTVTTAWADGRDTRIAPLPQGVARAARIEMSVLATGRATDFTVDPLAWTSASAAKGRAPSPALTGAAGSPDAGPSTQLGAARQVSTPPWVEDEDTRTCSVPRNHPGKQAVQPTPRQIEWAVNQAVSGTLNEQVARPADWRGHGMDAYYPQGLFPRHTLDGGGNIPSQVMLGVAAQESNLWQAARFALPGQSANPLIGNYYGLDLYNAVPEDDWAIDWADADCGYGVTQVTDGMRLPNRGQSVLNPLQQEAVALDYTANIAAGVRILEEKWNQTRAAGMTVNGGDPRYPENWFFALWAYNSGFYPESAAGQNDGAWGVGWTNNPAAPMYEPNRRPFLDNGNGGPHYADAARPQHWPYPEKVLGWAAWPIEAVVSPDEYAPGYRAAWWMTNEDRENVKPPADLFCTSANWCEPSRIGGPDGSACRREDFKCWWNQPVEWKDCGARAQCGNAVLRFDSSYPEQPDGTSYPPNCRRSSSAHGNAAPPGALIVDNLPGGYVPPVSGCANADWTNRGSFDLEFASPNAAIDTHQLGGGFGGHFTFAFSRSEPEDGPDGTSVDMGVTGTWTLDHARDQWMRIAVHLPDIGARTQRARYEIDTGDGTFSEVRYLNQKRRANNWVSLGVYPVDGVPRVRLSSDTEDGGRTESGDGSENIAFDAVAFQPLTGKPDHIVAVLGDSYASGEGAGSYYRESDIDHGHPAWWNACRRSEEAWARQVRLPATGAVPLGRLADRWSPLAELGFVACSGAQTKDLRSNGDQPFGEGQFGEVPQVDSGVLTEHTTLVMLTAGGNDEYAFAEAVRQCAIPWLGCDEEDDPEFLEEFQGRADRMRTGLRRTLRSIAEKAPNAQIVLMGYPRIIDPEDRSAVGCLVFNDEEARMLATLAEYVGERQREVVDGLREDAYDPVNVRYADPVGHFAGHAACGTGAEWIHGLVDGPNGDGDFHPGDPVVEENDICPASWSDDGLCLSREAFHPNADGQRGYAEVMEERLREIGYRG